MIINKQKLDKYLRFYIHHRALYSKGWGELGFIKNLLSPNTIMLGWLFAKSFIPDIPYWTLFIAVPLIIIVEVTVGWTIGNWWDKNKFFQKEADWAIKRNPALKGMADELLKDVKIEGY